MSTHTSKRTKSVLIIILCVVVLLIASFIIHFFTTTTAYSEISKICQTNSNKGATSFFCYESKQSTDAKYIFAVAENGGEKLSQEIFIFRQKRFFGIDFNRYCLVKSSNAGGYDQSDDAKIGITITHLRKDGDPRATKATLLCYASVKAMNTSSFLATFKTSFGTETIENEVNTNKNAWIIELDGLSGDADTFKKLQSLKLFDEKGKLLNETTFD